jgi:hypothetical protein
MTKVTEHRNYRVSVYAEELPWRQRTHKEWMAATEKIRQDIRRHVDDIGSAIVEYDTVHYCSFCFREWEVDGDGCPTCCSKAEEEWMVENGKTSDDVS